MARRAVVLMNLGGPDRIEAVRPFLYNLFSDKAIIGLPTALRLPLAWLIAARRAATAREIYAQLGGGSPLLPNTEAQAEALNRTLGADYRCFIAMRYWRPLTRETVRAVMAWNPDKIILLPLYPQYSTTTTRSSVAVWQTEAARAGLSCRTRVVSSYPTEPGFVAALSGLIADKLTALPERARPRLLLSAHGLPLKIVRAGDPYPNEIAQTAAAIATTLRRPDLDQHVCYQSRVGPLAWLGPSVEEELRRAAADNIPVVIAPISFVSEHSETLVELDRDYARMAREFGVPAYYRVATVGTDERFIAGLAALVTAARQR